MFGCVSKNMHKRNQQIIRQHLADIEDTKRRFYDNKTKTNDAQLIQSLIDIQSASHVCTKSLDELKPISLWQLKPNTVHYGFKLMVKIMTPPDKLLCVRTIIKDIIDSEGKYGNNLMELSVYNLIPFGISLSQLNKTKILCKDTVIGIKEPFLKIYKSKKLGLRVDNPLYNLVIIKPPTPFIKSPILNTVDALKSAGNACFHQQKYRKAVSFYSDALKVCKHNDMKVKLLLNRSLCFIKQNENELAFIGAQNALKMDPGGMKVKYRYLCALCNIAKYEEALAMIKDLDLNQMQSAKIKNDFKKLWQTIKQRCNEYKGEFNAVSYKMMRHKTEWKMVEDYIGDIEIKWISKAKGRGIVATRNIKQGELVLVEKAFAFGDYKNGKNVFVQTVNNETKSVYSGRNQELILKTISKCFCCDYADFNEFDLQRYSLQSLLNKWKLLQLFDGNECVERVHQNMMKIFRGKRLLDSMDERELNGVREAIISAKRVSDVICANAFETLLKPENIKYFLDHDDDEKGGFDLVKNERFCGCGLWIISSLFNHCNESNAERCVYYKTMFIKTKREIQKGEEITISYIDQTLSANNKQKQLKNWGIDPKT